MKNKIIVLVSLKVASYRKRDLLNIFFFNSLINISKSLQPTQQCAILNTLLTSDSENKLALVKSFLEKSVDINGKDETGMMPLLATG